MSRCKFHELHSFSQSQSNDPVRPEDAEWKIINLPASSPAFTLRTAFAQKNARRKTHHMLWADVKVRGSDQSSSLYLWLGLHLRLITIYPCNLESQVASKVGKQLSPRDRKNSLPKTCSPRVNNINAPAAYRSKGPQTSSSWFMLRARCFHYKAIIHTRPAVTMSSSGFYFLILLWRPDLTELLSWKQPKDSFLKYSSFIFTSHAVETLEFFQNNLCAAAMEPTSEWGGFLHM